MPNVPVQQTGGAVMQQKPSINSLLANPAVKSRMNDMLGDNAAKFMSSIISVAKSPTLFDADPNTIMSSAFIAAALNLPINPNLGFAYIVPYNNKGHKEAQFQIGYKGIVQLAQRSGQYEIINATEVREGELVSFDLLTGEVELKAVPNRESRKVIGYIAHFKLLNGFKKSLYMSAEEMDAHAKKYSQSYRNDKYGTSLWKTQFDVMAKKTVLKLLLSKFGPQTVDMQMVQKFDQAVVREDIASKDITFDEVDAEYVDNQPEEAPVQKSVSQMMREAAEGIASTDNAESK